MNALKWALWRDLPLTSYQSPHNQKLALKFDKSVTTPVRLDITPFQLLQALPPQPAVTPFILLSTPHLIRVLTIARNFTREANPRRKKAAEKEKNSRTERAKIQAKEQDLKAKICSREGKI